MNGLGRNERAPAPVPEGAKGELGRGRGASAAVVVVEAKQGRSIWAPGPRESLLPRSANWNAVLLLVVRGPLGSPQAVGLSARVMNPSEGPAPSRHETPDVGPGRRRSSWPFVRFPRSPRPPCARPANRTKGAWLGRSCTPRSGQVGPLVDRAPGPRTHAKQTKWKCRGRRPWDTPPCSDDVERSRAPPLPTSALSRPGANPEPSDPPETRPPENAEVNQRSQKAGRSVGRPTTPPTSPHHRPRPIRQVHHRPVANESLSPRLIPGRPSSLSTPCVRPTGGGRAPRPRRTRARAFVRGRVSV